MAKTISSVQTDLAYRLGEATAPTNITEKARRLSWFKEAINNICDGQTPMWFLEEIYTTNTVTGQQYYNLPDDFRLLKQVKLDGYKYEELDQDEIYAKYEEPNSPVPILPAYLSRACYIYDDALWFIPIPSSTPSAFTLTDVAGVVATGVVTCTYADHGLNSGDYVTIAASADTAYNGTFRVKTVADDDTFTYVATSTLTETDPTGTITATKSNIIIHYWEYPTEPTADTSSIILPDQFSNILVAYAEGRYWSLAHKRAKASDAFTEYETLAARLQAENHRRKFRGH